MPRTPKPKMTPEMRAAQNRANSSYSTGPRTDRGKEIVSRNAYKHGLRAESIVIDTEDLDTLSALSHDWNDCYRPQTPGRQAVLDRCVFAQTLFLRGVRALNAATNEQVALAEGDWERKQREEVATHKATLLVDPEKAVVGLMGTAAGCRWLIGEWATLRERLEEDGCWYAATHRDMALRLFGLDPEVLGDPRTYWIGLLNRFAEAEVDAESRAWFLDPRNIPDTLRGHIDDVGPDRDDCVAELRRQVDDELTVLKGREEYLRMRVEDPCRRAAPVKAEVLEGETGKRMVRYMQMNDAMYHRAYKELQKEEKGVAVDAGRGREFGSVRRGAPLSRRTKPITPRRGRRRRRNARGRSRRTTPTTSPRSRGTPSTPTTAARRSRRWRRWRR